MGRDASHARPSLWRGFSRPVTLPAPVERGQVLIEARGLGVDLSGTSILGSVDLDVRAGEVVALVGPNGAGKSTLMGALVGDIEASRGEVLLHGRSLADWSSREAALRRAVLPQKIAVGFPFLVEDHVRMGRAPWIGTPQEALDDEIIDDAITVTGTRHLVGRQLPSLSGGELARVAFARVLAQRTQLVLLDEPTAALDIHYQEQVLATLGTLARGGAGVVIVVHDLTVAASHADRVALIDAGGLVAMGPPAEVMTASRLSEVYRHRIDVLRHPHGGSLIIVPEPDRNAVRVRVAL